MKVHWVLVSNQKEVTEITWNTACGMRLTDEEVEAGRASPDASDATCGHCRRCAAARVHKKLEKTEVQEIAL